MGQCGCGDFGGGDVVVRLGDYVLALDIYRGCDDCDTPIGVRLTVFKPEEAVHWGIEVDKLTELDMKFGLNDICLGLVGREEMVEAAKGLEYSEGDCSIGFEDPDGSYDSLADFMNDHILGLLQRALVIGAKKREESEERIKLRL